MTSPFFQWICGGLEIRAYRCDRKDDLDADVLGKLKKEFILR